MQFQPKDIDVNGAATAPRPPTSVDTSAFAPFEWMLARRYLRARRKEGFISVIAGFSFVGIMLGVATLIIVMSVMNGFRNELIDKMVGLNGHVLVHRVNGVFEDYEEVRRKLSTVPGVKAAIPLVEGQAMVASNVATLGAIVRGVSGNHIGGMPLIADNVRFGSLDNFDAQEGIALGIRLATMLRVQVGDSVNLVSPRGAVTPFGTAPRIKAYKVVAIFELGMSEYDKSIALMPLAEAQKYFSRGAQVDVLEMMVEKPRVVNEYLPALRAAGGQGLHFTDWQKRNEQFLGVLQTERVMMFIILSLIILVAALNIISGLIMLVKDKGRDIAILRTMGATKAAVMRVFLITGSAIGIVGTIAGLVLAIVFCRYIEEIRQFIMWALGIVLMPSDVYFLSRLPAQIDPRETALIVGMALGLSVLATLYPAWRASRLDPVEALRYE